MWLYIKLVYHNCDTPKVPLRAYQPLYTWETSLWAPSLVLYGGVLPSWTLPSRPNVSSLSRKTNCWLAAQQMQTRGLAAGASKSGPGVYVWAVGYPARWRAYPRPSPASPSRRGGAGGINPSAPYPAAGTWKPFSPLQRPEVFRAKSGTTTASEEGTDRHTQMPVICVVEAAAPAASSRRSSRNALPLRLSAWAAQDALCRARFCPALSTILGSQGFSVLGI